VAKLSLLIAMLVLTVFPVVGHVITTFAIVFPSRRGRDCILSLQGLSLLALANLADATACPTRSATTRLGRW
jgi:hypothetical protein